jgi:Flp pilus assembly protein TadG
MVRFARLRRRRDEGGAAAVEFALVGAFVVVPLVLAMLQYGWYFYIATTTSHAANAVTRRLEVGDCWTGTAASQYVANQIPTSTTTTKSPSTLAGATIGTTQITVTVSANANIVGFFPMPNGGTVTRTVNAQLEDDQAGASCP